MSNSILDLANAATEYAPDMTVASAGGGGGDYVPPAEGIARARLVGYIEYGVHETSAGAGKPKVSREKVKLMFELSGPNHEPKVLEDGTKLPHRVSIDLNGSKNYGPLNEKAGLYKAFRRMNYDGAAKHMSQLLGKAFLLTIRHDKKVGSDGKERTYVSIRDEGGLLVQPPRFVNPLDNTITEVPVDPPLSQLRLFMWNAAPELQIKMWESLFIDGEYPARTNDKGEVTAEARSKNVLQQSIKEALNFKGSPIYRVLQTGGVELKLGAAAGNGDAGAETASQSVSGNAATATSSAAQQTAAASTSDDPLANI